MDFLHSKFFFLQKIRKSINLVMLCVYAWRMCVCVLRVCVAWVCVGAHVRACMWVGELPILQFQRFFSEYVNLLFFDRVWTKLIELFFCIHFYTKSPDWSSETNLNYRLPFIWEPLYCVAWLWYLLPSTLKQGRSLYLSGILVSCQEWLT